jgi:two-component system response regulator FlrC
LDNVVQRALILQSENQICAQDLQFETPGQSPLTIAPAADQKVADGENLSDDLRSREQSLIVETLRSMRGNRKATAEKLGISQRTLRYKLARMREDGVSIPGSLSAEGI